MQNGNVYLDIPLLQYPQRGTALSFNFNIRYNDKQWLITENSMNGAQLIGYWAFDHSGTDLGVSVIRDQAISGGADLTSYSYSVGSPPIPPATLSVTSLFLVTPDGARHYYGDIAQGSAARATVNTVVPTTDGSGFVPSNVRSDGLNANQLAPTYFLDRNGIKYFGNTVEDPNGNEITANSSGWTDSTGRIVPGSSSGPGSATHFWSEPLPGVQGSTASCKAGTASARVWTVPTVASSGGSATYYMCYANFSYQTAFHAGSVNTTYSGVSEASGTALLLSQIVLPNGSSYQFSYDSYLSLQSVTLPTGGTISYTWQNLQLNKYTPSFLAPLSRGLATRTVNDGTGAKTWHYQWSTTSPGVTTTVTDPSGNDEVHIQDIQFRETEADFYQGCSPGNSNYCSGSGTLLKRITRSNFVPVGGSLDVGATNVGIPYASQTVTTTIPLSGSGNAAVSQVVDSYISAGTYTTRTVNDEGYIKGENLPPAGSSTVGYGQLGTRTYYDFGLGTPGSALKTATTRYYYQDHQPYGNPLSTGATQFSNLLDLPESVVTTTGTGSFAGETDYSYDQGGCSTTGSGVTVQHVSPPNPVCGNLTTMTRVLTGGSNPSTSTAWNDAGMPVSATNPRNYSAQYENAQCAGSVRTKTTDPLGHVVSGNYDCNTGVLTSFTDENAQTTTYGYDVLSRLSSVSLPDGGQTTYCNTDTGGVTCTQSAAPYKLYESQLITSSSGNKTSVLSFDGLGRDTQTQLTSDPDGVTYSAKAYDNLGRVSTVYNPTRCNSPTANCGETTWGATSYTYDAIGRVKQKTEPDGSSVTTTYSGNCSTVTDEVLNARTLCLDGLGRLTNVFEDPGHLDYETDYSYDALDNLIGVSQGSLVGRNFTYDSLSRLTSATNPESGTTSYTYDADGNVMTRTRPAPNQSSPATTVTTTYQYDALDRLTQQSYSDGTTFPALFGYDRASITMNYPDQFTISNSIGRLSWTCVVSRTNPFYCGSMTANSYDSMGRMKQLWQENPVNSNDLWVSYSYDLIGDEIDRNLSGSDYASTYNAAGRLTAFTSTNYNDATNPPNLLSGGHYDPFGHLTSATLANGLTESWGYDNRGRLQAMATGTTCSAGKCSGSSVYGYAITNPSNGQTGYAANGNVLFANDSVNGNWSYTYDGLNRLLTSNCSAMCPDGLTTQGFSYGYDRFGNRWQQNVTAGSGPAPQFSFDSNNHIVGAPSPCTSANLYCYDAAGNLLNDGLHQYRYDAENRIISVDNGATAYTYDAGGRRVAKNTGGASTDFIYDREGHVILTSPPTPTMGEIYVSGLHLGTYDLNAAHTDGVFYYNHSDWLGTERVRTDLSGKACETTTGLPFGDGQTIVTTCGDVSPRHFTGKERDTESGLDNFEARYYASTTGRFMSPDWSAKEEPVPYAKLDDPQSLNLYQYVGNNPLTHDDPDGHAFGIDDLIGALAGGTVGVGVEVVKDLALEQHITTGKIAGAAVGGALFGEGIVNAPETLGGSVVAAAAAKGAVQGAVSNAVEQGVDIATGTQKDFSGKSLAVSTVAGAVTAGIAAKVPDLKVDGVTAGRGNMKAVAQGIRTKIANGNASQMSLETALKGAIGGQVATAGRTATEGAADVAAKKSCNAATNGGCN